MSAVLFFPSIPDVEKHIEALRFSSVYFLADANTALHCLGRFSQNRDRKVITIPAGEQHKNLDSCTHIWEILTKDNADRNTLLINIGGGVVCDMGGFAASCYKRGISFINIPTSLLGMVDAAVGGKTGVDFNGLKNLIGTFTPAHQVLVCNDFLQTLPERELTSGLAEVIKHYLINDAQSFRHLHTAIQSNSFIRDFVGDELLIKKAIAIKSSFTAADPYEQNIRKALNFGHTIGHAVESYYLSSTTPLLHGESIAIGMICEAFISKAKGYLTDGQLSTITETILSVFANYLQPLQNTDELLTLMKNDKKNQDAQIQFSLLKGIGEYAINETAETLLIQESISYYNERYQAFAPHPGG